MYWGFGGACAFGVVAYAFKPDTRYVRISRLRDGWWIVGKRGKETDRAEESWGSQ
jgi:hypothetical protein